MSANEAPAEMPSIVNPGSSPEALASGASTEVGQERQAPAAEHAPQGSQGDPAFASLPSVQPVAAAPVQGGPAQDAQVTNASAPIVAADEDVIEREWVQKAKQIVSNTKSDPHSQEQEVGKLQADYLKKRYGKDVKLVGN